MKEQKTLYYFDSEKCTYIPVQFGKKEWMKYILKQLTLTGIFFSAILLTYLLVYQNPEIMALEYSNEELKMKLDSQRQNLLAFENRLSFLSHQDDFLWTQLNVVDSAESNVSAADNTIHTVKEISPELINTHKQLSQLNYKIRIQDENVRHLVKSALHKRIEKDYIPGIKPVPGNIVSLFGMRKHPIFKISKMHTGVDFEATPGTAIVATANGVVAYAGKSFTGYGYMVEIDHGNGYVTRYAHLGNKKIMVHVGEEIKRGEVIGLSGNTGISSGPHLHYEVIKDGHKIDPLDYIFKDETALNEFERKQLFVALENLESMD